MSATRLLEYELFVVVSVYFLAGIPVAAALLATRLSPFYQLPPGQLVRWWSRTALTLTLFAYALALAGR